MAKQYVVIDELHLTIRVPNDLPEAQSNTISEILNSGDFLSRLRRVLRTVIREYPSLAATRVSLTR